MKFNTNIYKVVWRKLLSWITPYPLRMKSIYAFMDALTSPVSQLHSDFLSYRDDVNYRIGITVQAVHLQRLLNDRYDIQYRRIVVENMVQYNATPFYLIDENKPVKFFTKAEGNPVILRTQQETSAYTVDFVVKVPIQVPFVMDEMIGLINAPGHKLESKTYKIIIV